MAASKKTAVLAVCILIIGCCAQAASLDDVIGGKQEPAVVKEEVPPLYSVKDIIDELPEALDENGNLIRSDWRPRYLNERTDKENFGECEDFYLHRQNTYGSRALAHTFTFLFSATQSGLGRLNLKDSLETLADPGYRKYSPESCDNNPVPLENLKKILNAIIQAAPAIIEEKRRVAAVRQEEESKKLAEKEAEEKRVQAALLAAQKAEEAQMEKLASCKATDAYKLYESSALIVLVNSQANSAKLEIAHQKEGAKISGYVDKQVMYKMGNTIAEATRVNQGLFASYRKLGGAAKNVESVRELPNPCSK